MREPSNAPRSRIPSETRSSPRRVVDVLAARPRLEIEALWRLTDEMAVLAAHPLAALDLVTRTAGEAMAADAAAVLLHPARDVVLASRWGDVGLPSGTKRPDLRRTLDAGWRSTAAVPLRSGARDIGCLWVGRNRGPFDVEAQHVLRTLGSVTSLALPTLLDTKAASTPHAPAERVADAVAPIPGDLRLASFPPARLRALRALDDAEDADAAARIVATDPLLASAALRAADAAAAGRARAARTVREAVVHLGLQRIRIVAATSVLRSLARSDRPIDAMLWSTAVGTSTRARCLAQTVGGASRERDVGLPALLSAVGTLALAASYPAAYEEIVRRSIRENRPLDALEQSIFGTDGDTLTRRLMGEWHLDEILQPRAMDATVLRHVVAWSWHATLALDATWRGLVDDAGAPLADPWWSIRVAESARALGLDDARAAIVERDSTALLDETAALVAAAR